MSRLSRPWATVPEPTTRRLGNGEVQRAVIKVLAAADQPMCLADLHPAVERLVGCAVSPNSVSWYLAAGARAKEPCFERPARGYYRLRCTE
jgi:hypothetical protein